MFERIQGYSFANIDKYSTAGLVTRLTTDVSNIQNAYQMVLRMCMRAPASLICALAMAFITNARISTIFLGAIIVLGIALFFIVNRARKYFTAAFPKYDELNASVQENVSAIRVAKAYVREDYEKMPKKENDIKSILIAPSWQKDNIVDSCLEDILDNLKGHGYKITVRPHPQHVRHMPEKMEGLKERYKNDTDIEIQTDFSSNSTVFEADLMITDWSGIAYEYAYTTCKPVLFIDTPMKIMNPEYKKIGIEPLNIWMRYEIGRVLKLDEIDKTADTAAKMLAASDTYKDSIDRFVKEYVYNLGSSASVGAKYIIQEIQKAIKRHKEQE